MRILIKLSGEALGENGVLFDFAQMNRVAEAIAELHMAGYEIAVVIGGGNIWRGRRGPAACMNAVTADQMGMLGTVINSLAMQDALERAGLEALVMSAVEMKRFAEPHVPRRAVELLKAGCIVLFAAGTGDPFHSTDTAAAQRAAEISADALLMAKNIDGIYDKNPHEYPDAKRIPDLTYACALSINQGAVDHGALVLLKEVHFPKLFVFALKQPETIVRAASGENLGTLVHP
ncbi:MAG: uridine monophosphate kinase [Clostridia bacterium]|nr:uridine monophosphate kinase [Clostridia bacterium]